VESLGYNLLDGWAAYTVAHGRNGWPSHAMGGLGGGADRKIRIVKL